MTLAQAIDFLSLRHNATGTPSYWTDAELYALISGRCQAIASIFGLIEATSTSTTTVAGTQAYAWPTDASTITRVLWNGALLQEITFREWELEKNNGTTPQSDPEKYVHWNRQVLLVPTPSSAQTLTFYYEKEHPFITASTGTIDIPSGLHMPMLDGCLGDMYAKSQNFQAAKFYEDKWLFHIEKTFPIYKLRLKNRARNKILVDADTDVSSNFGVN